MPFDVRCQFCRTKLRLDEAPEPGTLIECPKCEREFPAPAVSAAPTPPPPPPPPPAEKKKSKFDGPRKREFMNPMLLLLLVAGPMLLLILVLGVIQFFLNRAGAVVEDSIDYISPEFKDIRGVNIKQTRKFVGLQSYIDKVYDPQLDAAYKLLAEQTGKDPETLATHVITARLGLGDSGAPLHYFILKSSVDRNFALGIPNSREESVNGVSHVRIKSHANPYLSNAFVYCPTSRLIILGSGRTHLDLALKNSREIPYRERTSRLIGTTGRIAIRGHIWVVLRRTVADEDANKPLPTGQSLNLGDYVARSNVIGSWVAVGGSGVRFGVAVELPDSATARTLAKGLKSGPLSKGDEFSPSSDLKKEIPMTATPRFGEFMQYLEIDSSGPSTMLKSKMAPENIQDIFPYFVGQGTFGKPEKK